MKTTVEELTRKVADLPPDFAEHVILRQGNLAKVKSFFSDAIYDVSIMMGIEEDERRVNCTCPATQVCKHIISFFAVAKGLNPAKENTDEAFEAARGLSEKTRGVDIDGLALIAEAIEKLVDGITLIVTERVKKETVSHAKDETP